MQKVWLKRSLRTFETLSLQAGRDSVKQSTAPEYHIIFAHGLNEDSPREWAAFRAWLMNLSGSNIITHATVHVFGFCTSSLLQQGDMRFSELSTVLARDVMRLWREGYQSDPAGPEGAIRNLRQLIFIGHGPAGWIIQGTVATFSFTSSLEFSGIIGIIFWGLPAIQNEEQWTAYSSQYLRSRSKRPSTSGQLNFEIVNQATSNFDLLQESKLSIPVERTLSAPPVPIGPSRSKLIRARFFPFPARSGTKKLGFPLSDDSTGKEIAIMVQKFSDQDAKRPAPRLPEASNKVGPSNAAKTTDKNEGSLDDLTDRVPSIMPTSRNELPTDAPQNRSDAATVDVLAKPDGHASSRSTTPEPTSQLVGSEIALGIEPSLLDHARLARRYAQKGLHKHARAIFEDVLERSSKSSSDSTRLDEGVRPNDVSRVEFLISIKYELAVLSLDKGDFRAAQDELKRLEMQALRMLGSSHPKLWEIWCSQGVLLDKIGDYQPAFERFSGALKIIEKSPTKADLFDNAAVHQIQLSLRSCQALAQVHRAQFQEALDLSLQVVSDGEDFCNAATQEAEKQERGLFRCSLQATRAFILASCGRYNEARLLNATVLEDKTLTLGLTHPSTLESSTLQALLLLTGGELKEAEQCCQSTILRLQSALGKSHLATLQALEVRVSLYEVQSRLTEALSQADHLLTLSNETLGQLTRNKHPQILKAMAKVAAVHAVRGELRKALELQKDVIEASRTVFGPLHPLTLGFCADLAKFQLTRGDMTRAKQSAWELFNLLRGYSTLAHDPEMTISRLGSLSEDIAEPLGSAMTSSAGSSLIGDEYSQYFCRSMRYLAICEREDISGDLSASIMVLNLLRKFQQQNSVNDIDSQSIAYDIAVAQRMYADFEGAMNTLSDLVESRENNLGEDHPETILTRLQLNIVQFLVGIESRIEDQEKLLLRVARLLGNDHVDTIDARCDLAMMLHASGYLEQADIHQSEALLAQLRNTLPGNTPDLGEVRSSKANLLYDSTTILGDILHLLLKLALGKGSRSTQQAPVLLHPARTLSSLERLAKIKAELGQWDNAIELQERLLQLQTQLVVPETIILNTRHDMALFYQNQADVCEDIGARDDSLMQAEELYGTVLNRISDLSLQPDSMLICATRTNLASVHFGKGEYKAAKILQKEVRSMLESDEHNRDEHMVIESIFNLALTERALRNFVDARKLLLEAVELSNEKLEKGMQDSLSVELIATLHSWEKEDSPAVTRKDSPRTSWTSRASDALSVIR
ncbi:hypothetical protein BDV96DRAFT_375433 [Lophiotrema nucula]|uniref:Tetratricopeptide repeat-domain-containing protein n=1 Tax=Lophiotrema nucula TaxID=690887 RepID=A0A6A5YGE1_9PLEO|nr:hypothetical protein BDV96DRAFT_375433 [Lophiotrema nucula]